MEIKDQYQQYECLMFDLDDTLYPLASGLSAQVTKNIQEYMLQKLGIEEQKVPELCLSLYRSYGTTMAGLKALGFDFDYDEFHSFVHGRLPYNLLKPDPVLRGLLLSLPIRKVIFTNSDKAHATRVLSRLGLEDCFHEIISFETLNPTKNGNMPVDKDKTELGRKPNIDIMFKPYTYEQLPKTPVTCKPYEQAFDEVFKMTKIDPFRTLFFDDSFRNIQTGKKLGLTTVLVGSSRRVAGADYVLESIHNLKEALPELWEAEEKIKSVEYSGKIAMTYVQA